MSRANPRSCDRIPYPVSVYARAGPGRNGTPVSPTRSFVCGMLRRKGTRVETPLPGRGKARQSRAFRIEQVGEDGQSIAETIFSQTSFASPNSITVLSMKNSSFCTPAYPVAIDRLMK